MNIPINVRAKIRQYKKDYEDEEIICIEDDSEFGDGWNLYSFMNGEGCIEILYSQATRKVMHDGIVFQ